MPGVSIKNATLVLYPDVLDKIPMSVAADETGAPAATNIRQIIDLHLDEGHDAGDIITGVFSTDRLPALTETTSGIVTAPGTSTGTRVLKDTGLWEVEAGSVPPTVTWEDGVIFINGEEGPDLRSTVPGVGISNITGPVSDGLVDTYTIILTNSASYTFSVTNSIPRESLGLTSLPIVTNIVLLDLFFNNKFEIDHNTALDHLLIDNVPPAGTYADILIVLKTDATGSAFIYPDSWKFVSTSTAPVITANAKNIFRGFTYDEGITWYMTYLGAY